MNFPRRIAILARSRGFVISLLLAYALSPLYLVPPMDREANFSIMEPRFGPFQWHKQALFEEDGHVDHLFLGDSTILHSIIPAELEAELRTRSGGDRTPSVINLSHNWTGPLLDYVLFSEFLEHRTCDVAYFSIPGRTARPHSALKYVFSWGDLSTGSRLPLRAGVQIYAEQLLIMPRLLINQVIGIDEQPPVEEIASLKGYESRKQGYRDGSRQGSVREPYREDLPLSFPDRPMHTYLQPAPAAPASPAATRPAPRTVPVQSQWQRSICDLIAAKAREHDVTVVFVDTPNASYDSEHEFGEQIVFAPDAAHNFQTISIPEEVLFSGVPRAESRHYFYNYRHLNDLGATVFSRALAALIDQCGLDETP